MDGAAAQVEQNLAHALLRQGDTESALTHFRSTLPVLNETGDLFQFAWALHGLGLIPLERGDIVRAAKLCAGRKSLHQQIGFRGTDVEVAEQQLKPLAARRGEPAVDKAWAEGVAMTVDEAVAYALAEEGTDTDPYGARGVA